MVSRILLVLGLQRAGTSCMTRSLRSGNTEWYREGDPRLYYRKDTNRPWELRPEHKIRHLLRGKISIFKALNDYRSKDLDRTLHEFRHYRLSVIYMFRDPVNQCASHQKRWGRPVEKFLPRYQFHMERYLPSLLARPANVFVVQYEDLTRSKRVFHDLVRELRLTRRQSNYRADSKGGYAKYDAETIQLITEKTYAYYHLLQTLKFNR